MVVMLDPECLGCGMPEGKCALNDCRCCDKCTHMFGEDGRKFICADCDNVGRCGATGPMKKRCAVCAMHHSDRQQDARHDVA